MDDSENLIGCLHIVQKTKSSGDKGKVWDCETYFCNWTLTASLPGEHQTLCPAASFLAIAAVICDVGAVMFSDPKSRF
jgi:hypothetical protein